MHANEKNEYVTGIYETGVSTGAHPRLQFDCLEGEDMFDYYGDKFLWLTYVYISSQYQLGVLVEHKSISKTQIESDPLKTIGNILLFLEYL